MREAALFLPCFKEVPFLKDELRVADLFFKEARDIKEKRALLNYRLRLKKFLKEISA